MFFECAADGNYTLMRQKEKGRLLTTAQFEGKNTKRV
jgi:hypothetical protein